MDQLVMREFVSMVDGWCVATAKNTATKTDTAINAAIGIATNTLPHAFSPLIDTAATTATSFVASRIRSWAQRLLLVRAATDCIL